MTRRSIVWSSVLVLILLTILSAYPTSRSIDGWKYRTAGAYRVLYINLGRRADRRKSIEKELSSAGFAFERIDAIDVSEYKGLLTHCWGNESTHHLCSGQLGCQFSHIKALKAALEPPKSHVAIFEDDFVWAEHVDPSTVDKAIRKLVSSNIEWDVIGLSLKLVEHEHVSPAVKVRIASEETTTLTRIIRAQTTTAYIVHANYIQQILDSFLHCDVQEYYARAIDICWQDLQTTGKWYGFDPQLGTQAPGYSDIESKNVSYLIL